MPQTAQQKSQDTPTGSTPHIPALVEKARAGSRIAFEQLVDLFQEDIFRTVYYRTRSRMDAEDLTQDIFIKAFKNLSGLKAFDRLRDFASPEDTSQHGTPRPNAIGSGIYSVLIAI